MLRILRARERMDRAFINKLKIKNCLETDIDAIIVLCKELMITQSYRGAVNDPENQRLYRDSLLRSIREEPRGCFVAILDGETIGFARAYTITETQKFNPRRKIGIIGPCEVKKDYRRKGIGTLLIESCFEYLKCKECTYVMLHVYCTNIYALRFYEKLGFRVLGGRIIIMLLRFWVKLGAKPLRARKLTIQMIKRHPSTMIIS